MLPHENMIDVPEIFQIARNRLRNYHRLEKIGSGTYGEVYKAIDLERSTEEHHEYVALKKIRVLDDQEGLSYSSMREIGIL